MTDQDSREPFGPAMPQDRMRAARWTGVLLMLLTSALVGVVAGLLSHAAGNNVPGAILTSGGAFAGAVGLLLALAHYVGAEAESHR
jgi:predicted branched-subunit amino acid permease